MTMTMFSTEIIESISPEDLQPTVKLCVGALQSSSIELKRSAADKLRLLVKNWTLIGESGAVPALIPLLRCSDGNVLRDDIGKMLYGCEHYRRRCKIRVPCCDQIFTCRHCHNEAASALSNPKERHEIVRHDVKQVAKLCSNCGVMYSNSMMMTVGRRDNYFHCPKCGSCYAISLRDNHLYVEDSMKNHCPICYEFLFDSTKQTTILKCGHTMHVECYEEMFKSLKRMNKLFYRNYEF